MDEFALIDRFFDRGVNDDSVVIGIGDDGAVTRCTQGRELVTVIDTLVADVHFPSSLRPRDIGYRAVAVNLSDIAAMGAIPRWMTLALTLDAVDIEWLDGFSRGLFEAADEYALSLVGGDTTSGTQIVISVQLAGEIEPGGALTRSGAGEGDDIYVSGTLGDSAMGLKLLRNGSAGSAAARFLVSRFSRPVPRVALGRALRGLASAAIDLSDGLYADTAKLLARSGLGGVIQIENIPVSDELRMLSGDNESRIHALSGGDDYELCFTAPAARREQIQQVGRDLEVAVTRIGRVTSGSALHCTLDDDPVDYVDAGYSHF